MNIPFEALSPYEIDMFDEYRSAYGATNEDEGERFVVAPQADAKTILSYWNSAKYDLFKLLGDKLVVKKDVCFKASFEDVADELSDIIEDNFIRKLRGLIHKNVALVEAYSTSEVRTLIENTTTDSAGIKFIDLDMWPGCSSPRCCYLSAYLWEANEDYFNNTISFDTFYIYAIDEGKAVKFERGGSLIKALGKLASLLHLNEEFEQFRIRHSRISNTKTLKGTLCLSIHPLDYMTMSDNGYDWNSCMSWIDGGCYRRGTVEMMNSCSVIVAYLDGGSFNAGIEGNRKDGRPRFSWSNKKWRTLIIVNKSFATTIKSYPYSSEGLSTAALEMIRELAVKNWNIEYDAGISHYGPSNEVHYAQGDVQLYFESNTMYNDFCRGQISYMLVNSRQPYKDTYYNYSGPAVCMNCGGIEESYASNGDVYCCDCIDECPEDYLASCYICGRDIYEYDEYSVDEINGRYYCSDHRDQISQCSCCGLGMENERIHPLLLTYKGFGATNKVIEKEVNDYDFYEYLEDADCGICVDCLNRTDKFSPAFKASLKDYPYSPRVKILDIDTFIEKAPSTDVVISDINTATDKSSINGLANALSDSQSVFTDWEVNADNKYEDILSALRNSDVFKKYNWSDIWEAKTRISAQNSNFSFPF